MGRGKPLTAYEKGQINALHGRNVSGNDIAREIGRSRHVVQNFLKNPEQYGKKKPTGRPSKLTARDRRRIIAMASNSTASTARISRELELNVSGETVRNVLTKSPDIVRAKMMPAPRLKPEHIAKRLEFARNNMSTNWEHVINTDEKKFNLDGPDGFAYYWRDLRREPRIFSRRNFGGGNVMVWAGISAKGKVGIAFTSNRMNSQDYQSVLQTHLLPFKRRFNRIRWIFQQDNAPIHRSRSTMAWFASKNITVMDWPACSPDISPIENLWGYLARKVYQDSRQFANVEQLKNAILEAWDTIDLNYLKTLMASMPSRIFDVIQRNGKQINY